jgi:hypothetical protein
MSQHMHANRNDPPRKDAEQPLAGWQIGARWLDLGLRPDADHPQRRHRQHQPQPLGPLRVGQHQPGMRRSRLPAGQPRGGDGMARKAADPPLPASVWTGSHRTQRTPGRARIQLEPPPAVDASERMPALGGDGGKQPVGIQPPVGSDDHQSTKKPTLEKGLGVGPARATSPRISQTWHRPHEAGVSGRSLQHLSGIWAKRSGALRWRFIAPVGILKNGVAGVDRCQPRRHSGIF